MSRDFRVSGGFWPAAARNGRRSLRESGSWRSQVLWPVPTARRSSGISVLRSSKSSQWTGTVSGGGGGPLRGSRCLSTWCTGASAALRLTSSRTRGGASCANSRRAWMCWWRTSASVRWPSKGCLTMISKATARTWFTAPSRVFSGQYGPMRDAKGVDLIAQAYGGLLSVTAGTDGRPAKAGFPIADLGSGMWGAIGVLAALHRVRAGHGGAYIDVSLADTIAGWSVWEVADYIGSGEDPGPLGTAHRLAAPYQGVRVQRRAAARDRRDRSVLAAAVPGARDRPLR